jgi:pimeloyl-ACP methyl ester carboxylesterase
MSVQTRNGARMGEVKAIPRRPVRTGLGAFALVVGLIGLPVGIGVGVMHLTKAGLSVPAAAGLVVLVCSLVLVVFGSVELLRRLPKWWRLVSVPVALVLLQFYLLPVAPAVYATNLPPTEVGDATPADRGLAYEQVNFTTSDGVRLSGWYVPSANGAAVALLHGSGSTRSAVLDHAEVLAGNGYGVLLYDDRGHGRSDGDGMDFGWWGDLDLGAAVSYLQTRSDVLADRIGVVGMSMGGEQAVNAAATDDRILAVVGEGVEPRVPADTALSPGPLGWVEQTVNRIVVSSAALLTDAPMPMPLRDAMTAIAPRPVLLIAGSGEVEAIRDVTAGAPGTVEVWELPDTPHTQGLADQPDEWEARVVDFLDQALVRES